MKSKKEALELIKLDVECLKRNVGKPCVLCGEVSDDFVVFVNHDVAEVNEIVLCSECADTCWTSTYSR